MVMPTEDNFSIQFEHLPTGEMVKFVGWVTSFQDNFTSNWNSTQVYGRMDPLSTFEGTSRQITLAFDVVAASQLEAGENDLKINRLIQFLYPVYEQGNSTTGAPPDQAILAAAPLLRMRYVNMAQNTADQGGLVGYLAGVDYSPNIEAGQFFPVVSEFDQNRNGPASSRLLGNKQPSDTFYYQETNISLSFTVLHSHMTGWVKGPNNSFYFGKTPKEGNSRFMGNFPHGGANAFINKGRNPGKRMPAASTDNSTDPTAKNGGVSSSEQAAKNNAITKS